MPKDRLLYSVPVFFRQQKVLNCWMHWSRANSTGRSAELPVYPDSIAGISEKNTMPEGSISGYSLLKQLIAAGNRQVIEKDINGSIHFNGNFRNAQDLESALDELVILIPFWWEAIYTTAFESAVRSQIFRKIELFSPAKAWGQSTGTWFQNCCFWKLKKPVPGPWASNPELQNRTGLSTTTINQRRHRCTQSPSTLWCISNWSLFAHASRCWAQQPGMTGRWREDILSRMAELGICWAGQAWF